MLLSTDASKISVKASHIETLALNHLRNDFIMISQKQLHASNFFFFPRKMALNSSVSILSMRNYSRFLLN